jgi:hypothetical protein
LRVDRTRDVVAEYITKTPVVRLVDNPDQSTPSGFNIGFDEETNDVVALMSGHAHVTDNFLQASTYIEK